MKFVVSKKALEEDIKALSKVINKKNSLPILTDFVLEVKGTTLIIMASDDSSEATTMLPRMHSPTIRSVNFSKGII